MNFATLTIEQTAFIENIKIDDMFITIEDIYAVREALNLYGKSVSELGAIRSSVIKHLGDKFEETKHNFDVGRKYLTNMSGITCVIDDMIFHMGSEV